MSKSEEKVVQYLGEAHASEVGLVSVLGSQIAMTPRGSYRDALEKHLDETRRHAERIQERLGDLGEGRSPFQAFLGLTETMMSEMLALGKMPFDLLRGSSSEEKVLKNAKDACATEELEIATYTALERLAIQVGDEQTAKLAASIRADEERMLKRIMLEIPMLTDAVVRAEIEGYPSYEVSRTGAPNGTPEVARRPRKSARQTQARAEGTTRRKAPGGGQGGGRRKDAGAPEEPLPIQRYRSLSAEEIVTKLPDLPESELGKLESYERQNKNRSAVLSRIRVMRGEEPWPGYDGLTVAEIEAVLNEGDYERAQNVLVYERAHENRPDVIQSSLIPARFVLTT